MSHDDSSALASQGAALPASLSIPRSTTRRVALGSDLWGAEGYSAPIAVEPAGRGAAVPLQTESSIVFSAALEGSVNEIITARAAIKKGNFI